MISAAKIALAVLVWLANPTNLMAVGGTGFVTFGAGYVYAWAKQRAACNTRVAVAVETTAKDIEAKVETETKARVEAAKKAERAVAPAPADLVERQRLCNSDADCRGKDAPRR